MTRSVKYLALAGFTLIALQSFGAPSLAIEKIKMTMAASSNNYGPYYAAIQKGYYKEEGFEVEIIKAGGGTATPALMSGSVDASTSGASALSAIMKGAPLRVVFFPWDRPTYQLWSTKAEITSVDQLKGKTIGIQTRGDTFEIGTRLVLIARGMDPNSVSYTPLGYGGGRRAAISSGSLPAAVLSVIDVARLKESDALKKGHMLVDMYKEIRMPYTGIAVATKAIEKDRGRIKRLVRATIKGLRYYAAYKDESVAIVGKYNKRMPAKVIAVDYDAVRASKTEDGTVPDDVLTKEVTVRAALIKVAKNRIPPLTKMFDFSMAHEVNKALDTAGWKPAR